MMFLISLQNLLHSGVFRIHRKTASVKNVRKSLVTHSIYINIGKFIQDGMLSNVQNVPKCLIRVQNLVNIRKSILARSLINVRNVAKALASTHV